MNQRAHNNRCVKCGQDNHTIKECRCRDYCNILEPQENNKKKEEPPTKKPSIGQL